MPRNFVFTARINTSDIERDLQRTRVQIERTFAPVASTSNALARQALPNTTERNQVAKAESQERIEAARRVSVELAELERRQTAEFIEQERRRTAALRVELRERQQAERQQTTTAATRPTSTASTASTVADDRLRREQELLATLRQAVAAENQRSQIALTSLREQLTQTVRISEAKLTGEREAFQLAERRRQQDLAAARATGGDTGQLERRHAQERLTEQRRILAAANQVASVRLRAEQQLLRASARSTQERLAGEARVAAAVERTARAQVAAAQVAVRSASGEDARIAAEQRLQVAVHEVSQAQQQRAAIQERANAEAITAEQQLGAMAERIAAERVEAERRVQRARQQTARAQPSGGDPRPGLGGGNATSVASRIEGLAGLATGGIAAFATVQLVRQIGQLASELNTLRVEAGRSRVSLNILSGGAGEAAAKIAAIQQAGGGAITTLNAVRIAVQATALGLASTTTEFDRLTTAARAVALVSPIIHDVEGAISEISLAGANQSFRRLDQLGLSVSEVKKRIDELQAANSSLTDEQAFSAAVIDRLNTKYGALLQTAEAQASGQERLTVAWEEFKVAFADTRLIESVDQALGALSERLKALTADVSGDFTAFGNLDTIQKQIETIRDLINEQSDKPLSFGIGGAVVNVERENLAEFVRELESAETALGLVDAAQQANIAGTNEYANELRNLVGQISQAGNATSDQITQLGDLSAALRSIRDLTSGTNAASSAYLQAQTDLGDEFLHTNQSAKELTKALIDTDAAYRSGKISSAEYRATINSLQQGLVSLRDAADAAAKAQQDAVRAQIQADAGSKLEEMVTEQAQGLIEGGVAFDVALETLKTQKQKIQNFFANLPTDLTSDELTLRITEFQIELEGEGAVRGFATDLRSEIETELQGAATELVAELGVKKANEILQGQLAELADLFAQLPDTLSPDQIRLESAAIADKVMEPFRLLQEEFASLEGISDVGATQALDQIAQALDNLNQGALDFVPGVTSARDELLNLFDEIAAAGVVTDEQAARLADLAGAADIVADSTGIYADILGGLGEEFFENNERAGDLLSAIFRLEGAHQAGRVGAEAHAGGMGVLIERMKDAAREAGIASEDIERAFEAADKFNRANSSRFSLTPGFQFGANRAEQVAGTIDNRDAGRKRETERRNEERAAQRAAREWEKAGREAEQAAKRAADAFRSNLEKVPGLFGPSSVTQSQLDLAAAGVPQNFADDWLRRLRDEVKNGKDWANVDIGDAAQRAGLDPNLPAELILAEVERQFETGEFFADAANLEVLNADAVKKSLDMQDRAKEGQENIFKWAQEQLGMAVESVTGAEGAGGIGVPSPADQEIESGRNLSVRFSGVDVESANASGAAAAQGFADGWNGYNFDSLIGAPLQAMQAAIKESEFSRQAGMLGSNIADLVKAGFDGRSGSFSWLSSIIDKIRNEVLEELAEAQLAAAGA